MSNKTPQSKIKDPEKFIRTLMDIRVQKEITGEGFGLLTINEKGEIDVGMVSENRITPK